MHDTGHGTPSGGFTTTHLRCVRYGPGCIAQLPEVIKDIKPNDAKDVKVLIITGKSLSQTPVLPKIEEILKKEGVYAGTFTKIRQHTPIEDVEEALQVIRKHSTSFFPSSAPLLWAHYLLYSTLTGGCHCMQASRFSSVPVVARQSMRARPSPTFTTSDMGISSHMYVLAAKWSTLLCQCYR